MAIVTGIGVFLKLGLEMVIEVKIGMAIEDREGNK